MWKVSSNAISSLEPKILQCKPSGSNCDCSDDDGSSCTSRDEGLECPVCWESFNIVENVPYVLWCGHTLCKNCVLGLDSAIVNFPSVPIQLPLFISCPWCHLLSFRLVYKGNLKFPRKNYFLLWMLESLNGDRLKSLSSVHVNRQPIWPRNIRSHVELSGSRNHESGRATNSNRQPESTLGPESSLSRYLNAGRIKASLRKSLAFFFQVTAKFPLVIVFILIVLYAIPASAAILVLYILVTILFAIPSFLILYFSYPSLEWLVREIVN
ncbi:hypothetical protein HPP92_019987 [Vanilla planifolia]|uniref:RING-type domain-containing protein n=1 Tax=Vanilla planifolia TaxID=51239 RepID=A0A835UM21_VANPL|nr:hypothetical protein HPP92_020420 [Vanilla planifolia]KAG0465823.1 hypothetical protein HPP92_019987 [Vanilla planifolia]